MTHSSMTIDTALQRIAVIHQQHSLKCFLSLHYLQSHFDWPYDDWARIESIIEMEEPYFSGAILGQTADIDVIKRRRHWVLQHGLYPYAYFVMQQWIEEGFNTVFDYYLKECLSNNLYLSHHLSILLAFNDAFSLLETDNQLCRFIERFCEFVTSTFYGHNQLQYPISPDFTPQLNTEGYPTFDTVFQACLTQPGFWGHNLITLSWIIKNKAALTETQYHQCLLNLYEQCHWVFTEDGDTPNITTLDKTGLSGESREPLEYACRQLLLKQKNNLHQITLAAAIVYLFTNLALIPSDEQRLLSIAHHFS